MRFIPAVSLVQVQLPLPKTGIFRQESAGFTFYFFPLHSSLKVSLGFIILFHVDKKYAFLLQIIPIRFIAVAPFFLSKPFKIRKYNTKFIKLQIFIFYIVI